MDKAIKKKWVKALRSGRYKQGAARLFDEKDGTHCCLGVLCRVMRLRPDNSVFGGFYGYGGQNGWLSDQMLERTGLLDRQQKTLMKMNDKRGKSFAQIADHIEKNL